jgi:hypothetical protein
VVTSHNSTLVQVLVPSYLDLELILFLLCTVALDCAPVIIIQLTMTLKTYNQFEIVYYSRDQDFCVQFCFVLWNLTVSMYNSTSTCTVGEVHFVLLK